MNWSILLYILVLCTQVALVILNQKASQKIEDQNPLVKGLHNAEYRHNNIDSTITLVPKLLKLDHRMFDVPLGTCAYHALHGDGVWLVAHFEDVVARDEAKSRPC